MATSSSTAAAAGGSAAPAAGAQAGGAGGPIDPGLENKMLSHYLLVVLGTLAGILLVWRLTNSLVRYVRTVACLNNDTQRYFAQPSTKLSWFKREVQYAPLLSKRHNREFALSSAVNMGTLPSRLQLVVLAGYFATNVAFCVVDIAFHSNFTTAAKQVRNRTGVLAVVNMIPLFLLAGRNNPLINLLGISFDTFNLLHRWLGRIVILEAVAHTIAFWAGSAAGSSWGEAVATTFKVPFMLWGFIATCALVVIGVQAMSVSRHAFYETFKIVHILLAALAVAGVWYHLVLKHLPQIVYIYPVIALWAFDRGARFLRVLYANVGRGGTRTLVEALPGGACRVTVTMARPWTFRPGQHAYLYMPSIGLWQSHPFSVAWSEEAGGAGADGEKLPVSRQDVLAMGKTSMSFVIRARTGFTGALYKKAAECKEGRLVTRCFVEGPYGGTHDMASYGTVMLVAGGVGITQAVPHVRELVRGFGNGTVAARRVVLVWIIQSPEHLEWIRPWMTEILAMDRRRDCLRIMLFVSRPRSTKEIHSPSATVQMFPGRPNMETLLGMEMEQQLGAVGVTVCGPGALSDEVRRAVRQKQHLGNIDFIEEAFSW